MLDVCDSPHLELYLGNLGVEAFDLPRGQVVAEVVEDFLLRLLERFRKFDEWLQPAFEGELYPRLEHFASLLYLSQKAHEFFNELRNRLDGALRDHPREVLDCIHEATGEVEDTLGQLTDQQDLLYAFMNKDVQGYEALQVVPYATLIRLVMAFPQCVFDGKVFIYSYLTLALKDSSGVDRLRQEVKERVQSYMKDALRLVLSPSKLGKTDLIRISIGLEMLNAAFA